MRSMQSSFDIYRATGGVLLQILRNNCLSLNAAIDGQKQVQNIHERHAGEAPEKIHRDSYPSANLTLHNSQNVGPVQTFSMQFPY